MEGPEIWMQLDNVTNVLKYQSVPYPAYYLSTYRKDWSKYNPEFISHAQANQVFTDTKKKIDSTGC